MKFEMLNWIFCAMGVFLLVVGIVIWAGKKIDLIHGEEAHKVAEYDIVPYSRLMGIGVIILALAVEGYGIISAVESIPPYLHWIIVGSVGAVGIIVMIIAHKKYFNGD